MKKIKERNRNNYNEFIRVLMFFFWEFFRSDLKNKTLKKSHQPQRVYITIYETFFDIKGC